MSTATLEIEVVELSSDEDEDEDAHFSCQFCYPEYIPGRKIIAFCGEVVEDTGNVVITNEPCECPLCNMIDTCPRCDREFVPVEF